MDAQDPTYYVCIYAVQALTDLLHFGHPPKLKKSFCMLFSLCMYPHVRYKLYYYSRLIFRTHNRFFYFIGSLLTLEKFAVLSKVKQEQAVQAAMKAVNPRDATSENYNKDPSLICSLSFNQKKKKKKFYFEGVCGL
jgi:hypothetical protein